MKNKHLVFTVCMLVVLSVLFSGCTLPFRRPAPGRQPERTPAPQPANPAPRTQPVPGQPGRDDETMADRVIDIATEVEGVDRAVAVVISNLALVGVTLERGEADTQGQTQIKREVATRIEDREPAIVNAYVSANPDIVKQLQEVSAGLRRGEPVSAFFDQITDILERMRAEPGNETFDGRRNQ